MKKLTPAIASLFCLALSACNGGGGSDSTPRVAGEMTPEARETVSRNIDDFSVQEAVEHLSGVKPAPLSTGSVTIAERGSASGRDLTRRYLREQFESYGLKVSEQAFTHSSGKTGANLEAVLEGPAGGKHLYITAHLDSVTNAGANDNASGLAAMLIAARALSGVTPRDTIHFVAFDLEELGYYGSVAYVRDRAAPKAQVIGDINADMIGHDAGGSRVILSDQDCDGASSPLSDAFKEGIREQGLDLATVAECGGRTDSQSFAAKGMPALFMCDDMWYGDYPYYHQATDTADRLMYDYLAEVTRGIAAAAARLAYPIR